MSIRKVTETETETVMVVVVVVVVIRAVAGTDNSTTTNIFFLTV